MLRQDLQKVKTQSSSRFSRIDFRRKSEKNGRCHKVKSYLRQQVVQLVWSLDSKYDLGEIERLYLVHYVLIQNFITTFTYPDYLPPSRTVWLTIRRSVRGEGGCVTLSYMSVQQSVTYPIMFVQLLTYYISLFRIFSLIRTFINLLRKCDSSNPPFTEVFIPPI